MSLLDSIKKGLMGEGDEYEDQYIDDGPQMVNNNSGVGIGMDEETEEPAEGTSKKNKVVNIHATTQLKVVLVKPERFEDASTIADHLNNKRTVVLNRYKDTAFAWHRYMASGAVMLNSMADFAQA